MCENHEYSSSIKLKNISNKYFKIPASIILNQDINEKRAIVFSFLMIRRGLDDKVHFTINEIVKWIGQKPNRCTNGINNKLLQTIESLEETGCTSFSNIESSYIEAIIDFDKLNQEIDTERFAVIYLDEVDTILNHPTPKDAYFNNDVILLVFAYLRMKIYRRRNKLMPEEINLDNKNNHEYDIESRRKRCPEVYDCYYFEIANDLGISARTVSKAVSTLNELGLIYSEALPRIKYEDKWRTDHTLFCNTYKREKDCLLDSGKDYYMREVANKKKKLNINT